MIYNEKILQDAYQLTGHTKDISIDVLDNNGKIKLFTAQHWKNYDWNDFRYFCHVYARYGIPTIESIQFLKKIINNRKVIEIGAGSGDLGYHLNIKMTDSKQQEDPEIKKKLYLMQQPVVKYPADVEKHESLFAIYKYKPKVVVASWITTYSPFETNFPSNPFGVKEEKILNLIDTFIIIGNIDIHGKKPILRFPHEEIKADWIISRARNPENNRIWIFNKGENLPRTAKK